MVSDIREIPFSSPSRSGEHFLKLVLGDISGTIKGVIWDISVVGEKIKTNDVLFITGEVKEYYGPQLVIDNYSKIKKENINRDYFQASSPRDRDEMWQRLKKIVRQEVTEKNLARLMDIFYEDHELVNKFKLSPAAKLVHHNYLGGLLEHTLEVVELCRHISKMYTKQIDRSYLLLPLSFMILGKLKNMTWKALLLNILIKGACWDIFHWD